MIIIIQAIVFYEVSANRLGIFTKKGILETPDLEFFENIPKHEKRIFSQEVFELTSMSLLVLLSV